MDSQNVGLRSLFWTERVERRYVVKETRETGGAQSGSERQIQVRWSDCQMLKRGNSTITRWDMKPPPLQF